MGSKVGSRVNQTFHLLFVLLLLISHQCDAISRETEAAIREFSKLRLEKRIPIPIPVPILTPFTGNQLQQERNGVEQFGETVAATENEGMGVEFKPSFPDTTNLNINYHHHPQSESDHHRNLNADYLEPGLGGFPGLGYSPPTTQQNPNFHRPLLGGPGGLDEDNSSVGMGIGPTGYSSADHHKNQKQQEEISNTPIGRVGGEDQPEVENSGGSGERGYGGLFDGGYSNDSEDENDQNPEGSYYGGGGGEGRGRREDDAGEGEGSGDGEAPPHHHNHPGHHHHNEGGERLIVIPPRHPDAPYDPDELADLANDGGGGGYHNQGGERGDGNRREGGQGSSDDYGGGDY